MPRHFSYLASSRQHLGREGEAVYSTMYIHTEGIQTQVFNQKAIGGIPAAVHQNELSWDWIPILLSEERLSRKLFVSSSSSSAHTKSFHVKKGISLLFSTILSFHIKKIKKSEQLNSTIEWKASIFVQIFFILMKYDIFLF